MIQFLVLLWYYAFYHYKLYHNSLGFKHLWESQRMAVGRQNMQEWTDIMCMYLCVQTVGLIK